MDDAPLDLLRLAPLFPAATAPLHISTAELGSQLGVSQQSASRLLLALEQQGYVTKRRKGFGQEIRLTPKGRRKLKSYASLLEQLFLRKPAGRVSGTVVAGLGEGAYYVGEYRSRLEDRLGYVPFPGTLNVRLSDEPPAVPIEEAFVIPPFERHHRTFGELKILSVTLAKNQHSVECHWIIPERTHHPEHELELIHEESLREKLDLKEGDTVEVAF